MLLSYLLPNMPPLASHNYNTGHEDGSYLGFLVFQLGFTWDGVEHRLASLKNRTDSRKSSQKRSSLCKQLTEFLQIMQEPRSLTTCQPADILRFLAAKDESGVGKTQVHHLECPDLGSKRPESCGCPMRLSVDYVRHLVSDIKNILSKYGRGFSWDTISTTGNPAAAPEVNLYIAAVKEEQAEAHVVTKQAKPMNMQKLVSLIQYLSRELRSNLLSPRDTFLFLRDRAFFLAQFLSGERGGDLSKLLIQQIFHSPNNEALILRQTFGKTRSEKHCVLKQSSEPGLCPVTAIDAYIRQASSMGIDMSSGFLFRKTLKNGNVINLPLPQSAINQRLVLHLTTIGRFDGESTHSLRSGCAVALRASNHAADEAATHIGWRSQSCWQHYSRSSSFHSASVAQSISTLLGDAQARDKADSKFSHFDTSMLKRAYNPQ